MIILQVCDGIVLMKQRFKDSEDELHGPPRGGLKPLKHLRNKPVMLKMIFFQGVRTQGVRIFRK